MTIEIGSNLIYQQGPYLQSLAPRVAIISDSRVASLYGVELKKSLTSFDLDVFLFSFPEGEQHKTRSTKELLENQLFEKGLGRDTCIVALGGGVVTDLAGFIAATYCRGVPLVMMPTSLLGMVDASIGGKNGVNVPYGKNLIGSIYQPKKVVIDITTLKSLSKKELSQGAVEMIKHGLIADKNVFVYLEANVNSLLALDAHVLERAISDSCRIKMEIVLQDERETGIRHLLNFGHTVGHALELLSKYTLPHGEAVALGLIVESYISVELGSLDQQSFERIKNILVLYGLPLHIQTLFPVQTMLDAMALDKKSLKGIPRFVALEAIGRPDSRGCIPVDESLIKKALQWMNDDLCRH